MLSPLRTITVSMRKGFVLPPLTSGIEAVYLCSYVLGVSFHRPALNPVHLASIQLVCVFTLLLWYLP